MASIRILIVEDFAPFRKFLRSTLRERADWQVICEVADGLEAVRKAEELKPDLILLDIGLPTLNGIEAAQQIRKLAPQSKIVFLTQESSADMVEKALSLGAWGYVLKCRAASDLPDGVEAVLEGRQFVSASLTGPTVVSHGNEHIEPLRRQEAGHHEIKFYADNATLADDFAQFTKGALSSGNAVVIIATESLRSSVLQRLRTDGVDLGVAAERYFPYDISDPLSRVMLDDAVKAARREGLHVAIG